MSLHSHPKYLVICNSDILARLAVLSYVRHSAVKEKLFVCQFVLSYVDERHVFVLSVCDRTGGGV